MISNKFVFEFQVILKNWKYVRKQPKYFACAIISFYVVTMLTRNRLIDICAGTEWIYIVHPYE